MIKSAQSEDDTVRSEWLLAVRGLLSEPAFASFFSRKPSALANEAALFDAIGQDLGSSDSTKREAAYWLLLATIPEITELAYERETRHPQWRQASGLAQQSFNQGMDLARYLYKTFVDEAGFNTSEARDPRPYVFRSIKRWQIDEHRARSREIDGSEILPLLQSTEAGILDALVRKESQLEAEEEIALWHADNIFSDQEWLLFEDVFVNEVAVDSVLNKYNVSKAALRQRMSRARKRAAQVRDLMVVSQIFWKNAYFEKAVRPSAYNRLLSSVRPGKAIIGQSRIAGEVTVWPLTRRFNGAPSSVYLVHTTENPRIVDSWDDLSYIIGRHLSTSRIIVDFTQEDFPNVYKTMTEKQRDEYFTKTYDERGDYQPAGFFLYEDEFPALNHILHQFGDERLKLISWV